MIRDHAQTSGGFSGRGAIRLVLLAACAMPLRPAFAAALLHPAAAAIQAGAPANASLPAQSRQVEILVTGNDQQPLAGVNIEVRAGEKVLATLVTDAKGHALLPPLGETIFSVTATLKGYSPAVTSLAGSDSSSQVEIVLSRASAVEQSVEVKATAESPVTEAASSETKLSIEQATESPLRPNTLIDALPLIPGVVRTPAGRVQISGMDEEHSTLIINSVNVSDPATGSFGLGVPVDTVDVLTVLQSPYLAQYGNFIAGVVTAETRRGGDKWNFDVNDPLPEFRIRSGHLTGLRDASPRVNLSGPILPGRLYLLEGTEYIIDKSPVRTLPFPFNETRSQAVNSYTQLDAIVGARQTVTGTLHFAPHSTRYANLNYFDPQPVTPNGDYQEDTGTLSDRLALGKGIVVSTVAVTRVATNVDAQTEALAALDAPAGDGMTLSPAGNSGRYFGQQTREATRFQWIETWNPATVEARGQHAFQLGMVIAHAEDAGRVTGRSVRLVDTQGNLLRTIAYSGDGGFSLADYEPAVYAQDHWALNSHLAVDAGIRWETQSLTYTSRTAPRAGFTYSPGANGHTVFRGGMGVFYDAVPLDIYAFSTYQQQTVTTYDGSGNITDGPRRYLNLTTTAPKSDFAFISQEPHTGNFAPYSVAWNVEAEHALTPSLMLRARYIHSRADNQLTLTPEVTPTLSALVLSSAGSTRSRQLDLTARIGASKQRQFFFSYVRQFAHGNLSDASSYLGDFPFPVVRPEIDASTLGEIPNRFLLWGTSVLPWRMRITPHIEYRNGYTWQPVDALQNYVAFSSYLQPRYPRYFSADARVSKDVNLGPKHAIRISVTGRNLTGHDNPLQIHNNIADPQYGRFFGNYGRHFLVDFDFLF